MDAIKKDPDIKFLTGTFLDRPQPSINSYTRVITVSSDREQIVLPSILDFDFLHRFLRQESLLSFCVL